MLFNWKTLAFFVLMSFQTLWNSFVSHIVLLTKSHNLRSGTFLYLALSNKTRPGSFFTGAISVEWRSFFSGCFHWPDPVAMLFENFPLRFGSLPLLNQYLPGVPVPGRSRVIGGLHLQQVDGVLYPVGIVAQMLIFPSRFPASSLPNAPPHHIYEKDHHPTSADSLVGLFLQFTPA